LPMTALPISSGTPCRWRASSRASAFSLQKRSPPAIFSEVTKSDRYSSQGLGSAARPMSSRISGRDRAEPKASSSSFRGKPCLATISSTNTASARSRYEGSTAAAQTEVENTMRGNIAKRTLSPCPLGLSHIITHHDSQPTAFCTRTSRSRGLLLDRERRRARHLSRRAARGLHSPRDRRGGQPAAKRALALERLGTVEVPASFDSRL